MTANSSDYGRLFFEAEVFRAGRLSERRARPAGAITEPARRVPLFRDCDVLVAGAGRPVRPPQSPRRGRVPTSC